MNPFENKHLVDLITKSMTIERKLKQGGLCGDDIMVLLNEKHEADQKAMALFLKLYTEHKKNI